MYRDFVLPDKKYSSFIHAMTSNEKEFCLICLAIGVALAYWLPTPLVKLSASLY
jgi:hypothetical protein